MGNPIPIHCAYTRLVPVSELRPHPMNANTHPPEQVRILAKIIDRTGWRAPITVSNRSGFIVAGHGRLQAALALGLSEVPADFQDFASEADELAHLLADNAIADMAELDPTLAKELAEQLATIPGVEFDPELAGLTNEMFAVALNPAPQSDGTNDAFAEWTGLPAFDQSEILHAAIFCVVRFKTVEDRGEFEKLLGYSLSHKGNSFSTWYPKSNHDQSHSGFAFSTE